MNVWMKTLFQPLVLVSMVGDRRVKKNVHQQPGGNRKKYKGAKAVP